MGVLLADKENIRLDVFLAQKLNYSRANIKVLFAKKKIWVNDNYYKASYRLHRGDLIKYNLPPPTTLDVLGEDISLDILYEDQDILVLNKKRGMVVHPAPGNIKGTLVNALLYHCKDLSGINGVLRPGIVHRLDKDTSGVMVVAKTDEAHQSLATQIQTKVAQRIYLAIVKGNISADKGEINTLIGRSPRDRKKMAVVTSGGKVAITYFSVLERFEKYTYVKCVLKTGRTHQIRVHMAYIGYPLLGDLKYAPTKHPFAIKGQALHSACLTLLHPHTKEKMIFTANLPKDMEDILVNLRSKKASKE